MNATQIVSTITSKGQVTIPMAVRRHLRLKPRDKIVFVVEEEGAVRLSTLRYADIASLRGAAGSLEEPVSWQQVKDIARDDHLTLEQRAEP